MTKSWQYQSDVQPVYVPPPAGNDGSGSTFAGSNEGMFVPRLPSPYRQPAYQPIMATMDPAALLLADETIPGQGPDTTGQNHFSTAFQPRLPPRPWNCFQPIENRLDPDSFAIGNFSTAQPDAMSAAPVVTPKRAPPIGSSFSTTDSTDGHGYFSLPSVPVREIRGSLPSLEQRPLFSGSAPVIFVDSAAPQPFVVVRRQQPASQFEGGDVSSALAPPPSMAAPVRRQTVLTAAGETLVLDLRYTADQEFAAWWNPLARPTLPPSRIQATADGAGTLGTLTPAGFVSAPLALPPGSRAPLNQAREELAGEPVPDLLFGGMASPVHQNLFRPTPIEQRPSFVDVGHTNGVLQPLAAPPSRRQPAPAAGETLLYAPAPAPVQVIIGCDLYAAIPVRSLLPRSQPGAEQPIVAQAVTQAIEPMSRALVPLRPATQVRPDGFHFADVGHTNGVLQPLAGPAPRQEMPRMAPMGTDVFLSMSSAPSVVFSFQGAVQLPAQATGATRPLPTQAVIVTEPTPIFTPSQTPNFVRSSLRTSPVESRPIFTDVPAAGEPLNRPSFLPAAPSRQPALQGSFVYAPPPPAVEVIVGCDLYTAVPMRPRAPATQAAAQQPIVAQAVPLDFGAAAAQVVPRAAPWATDNMQPVKIDVPSVPASLAVPVYPPRRPLITLVEPAPAPQGFQVLAGLDSMQCGAIAARMRPQAAGVLVIDQQNYRVPDVSGFQSAWPSPVRPAPLPVWQPIESISTTVFYGATGNPPAFVGVGQVLVTATDLWVFAPTAARIEVGQRGNRLTR